MTTSLDPLAETLPDNRPETKIRRDQWGRPLVIPEGGGKPVGYTRCTTFTKSLEDMFGLGKWEQRMVAIGLVERKDLRLAVAAHFDDKEELNRICEQAKEAAKSHAAATTGTALHRLCERYDHGETLGVIPDDYLADVEAYVKATEPLEPVAIEEFMVQDTLKVGGTPDRMVAVKGIPKKLFIADIKSGSIDLGAGAIAMQLAMYARSKTYNVETGERTQHPDLDLTKAIVIHLPAGTGTCTLHWIDIKQGWTDVLLARAVREHRKRKGWLSPFSIEPEPLPLDVNNPTQADIDSIDPIAAHELPDRVDVEICDAKTVAELTAVWSRNQAAWTQHHTDLAAARKARLIAQGDAA